jgi:putative heme-binding domain-containing protein
MVTLAESGKVSPRLLLRTSVASALESRAAGIRSRVTALTSGLPSESVRLDQVIAARAANYQPNRTDVKNGAKVFSLNCAICHRYKDVGANIGPSLDGIGVRGPAKLFEDILDPSRNVDPAFQRTTLRLKSGEEVVGMNLQTTPDSVTVTELGGKVLTFPASQVTSTKTEAVSIMPPAFEQAIAPDDLNDLIAYLIK